MTRARAMGRVSLAGLTAMAVACGGKSGKTVEDDAGPPPFIADDGDFDGFTSWQSFDGGSDVNDSLDGGLRTLYLNRAPPPGSLTWPQGTIIVKTTQGAETFAMAKRGGGFNPELDGWEWFGLQYVTPGAVSIAWRGTGPTGSFVYANMPPTGCNNCHVLSYQNDFVAGTSLQLSRF